MATAPAIPATPLVMSVNLRDIILFKRRILPGMGAC
jgi:hypothetical protein